MAVENKKNLKILIAKAGLDGHDRGVKIVVAELGRLGALRRAEHDLAAAGDFEGQAVPAEKTDRDRVGTECQCLGQRLRGAPSNNP